MELFNTDSETFLSILFSIIPFTVWAGFLSLALFSPLDKLFESLRGQSFSLAKLLLIASFFVSGPFLIILGIIILVLRYKKASPSQRASIDNKLQVLKEQAQRVKAKTEQLSSSEFEKQIPDFLKAKLSKESKPTEKSMSAALRPSTSLKQDNGIGRAFLLIILLVILGFSYWLWDNENFQSELQKVKEDSLGLIDQ